MNNLLCELILWGAIISTGLMAGVYFAFSFFIMNALKVLPDQVAIACMNSINKVILKSIFMPLFFVSSIFAIVLIFIADTGPSFTWIVSGSVVYLLGMLACTLIFNVPLNNRLLTTTANFKVKNWQHYLIHWTRWNHIRTTSSLIALIFYIFALLNG